MERVRMVSMARRSISRPARLALAAARLVESSAGGLGSLPATLDWATDRRFGGSLSSVEQFLAQPVQGFRRDADLVQEESLDSAVGVDEVERPLDIGLFDPEDRLQRLFAPEAHIRGGDDLRHALVEVGCGRVI